MSDEAGWLTTAEVAMQLGRTIMWVQRHAKVLGGRMADGVWHFPQMAIERRVSTVAVRLDGT
jgi:hypothetical protein